MSPIKAIIFDMDGLVLDTESTYCAAWQRAAAEMGCEFTDEFCLSMSGLHYQHVEKKLLEHCGVEFDLKLFATSSGECWRQYVGEYGISVKKGFFNLLAAINAKNLAYCLATNSRKSNALECLTLAGIENVFSLLISRDDVEQGKPAPDIFLTAAQRMNQAIEGCVVIEDSVTGIQAAVNAGVRSIYVPSVLPADLAAQQGAAFFANDLDEVIALIN